MGMCLFAEDDYEEVAAKLTGAFDRWGCWDAAWTVPTAAGITQGRKRLGPRVLAEVFEQVAGPVAALATRGAWLRGWRLLAIDESLGNLLGEPLDGVPAAQDAPGGDADSQVLKSASRSCPVSGSASTVKRMGGVVEMWTCGARR